MKFTTDDINIFHDMIEKAIKSGLQFEAYVDHRNDFVIEYTGGY